jgi:hypothetical protein
MNDALAIPELILSGGFLGAGKMTCWFGRPNVST